LWMRWWTFGFWRHGVSYVSALMPNCGIITDGTVGLSCHFTYTNTLLLMQTAFFLSAFYSVWMKFSVSIVNEESLMIDLELTRVRCTIRDSYSVYTHTHTHASILFTWNFHDSNK
jgi:hypothetical protein